MSLFDAFFPTAFARGGPTDPSTMGGGCGCGCGHADGGGAPSEPDGTVGRTPAGQDEDLLGRTLNAWVLERPAAVGVFEALGLDACCGGERSLSEACRLHGLDPLDVLERLRAVPVRAERGW